MSGLKTLQNAIKESFELSKYAIASFRVQATTDPRTEHILYYIDPGAVYITIKDRTVMRAGMQYPKKDILCTIVDFQSALVSHTN